MFARLMAVSRIGVTAGATELQMKNRLRLLRAEKNWSQADLGGAAGSFSSACKPPPKRGKTIAARLWQVGGTLFEMTNEQIVIDDGSR
jgi:hypothetical protein